MWRVVACVAAVLGGASAGIIVYTPDRMIAEEFRDMPASFGPDLPSDGLTGLVVGGRPEDGCGPLAPPPTEDNFTGRWIVVVGRYNCSFEEKVRNAQAAGYHCVIVHNVNSSDLETMSAKDPEGIDIPSVFVGDVAGLLLTEDYNYTSGYFVMVNGDLPFNINTHLLLPFAIVVVICLLVILIFMIVKCIKDRRRARRHRLPNRCLRKIPTCKFSKGDPYDTCAICLDDYVEGERLRVLPCAHAYHAKCIDPWLTQNRRVCPVCKRRVMAAGETRRPRRDSDSDSDDTEPLIASSPPQTQGGTFEPQRENPFVRAARFMARLRRARHDEPIAGQQEAPPDEPEPEPEDSVSDEIAGPESAPLLPARVRSERERPPRARRSRRARSASAPAPPPPPPEDQHTQTDTLSINADTSTSTGEIGVAALPAPRDGATIHPPHVNL